MSRADILEKIVEARDLGGKVVVIAGEGEPTLDPSVGTIVSAIDDFGMIPIIYTNGSTVTPESARFFRDHNACIVIAVDSLRDDVYAALTSTRPETLRNVLQNLAVLRKVYADTIEHGDGLRVVRLALNMTVCSLNMHEMAALREYASSDMYFVCNPLARHGNADLNWAALIADDTDFAEQQELVRRFSESGGPLTLNQAGVCGYSMLGIGIGPFGHYMTCAYTPKTNGLLGTVWDRSLRDAYFYKLSMEREHYEKYGKVPCLVRSDSFETYLGSLGAPTNHAIAT